MCSGQTGGGAWAGEAEIRASIRETQRHCTARNGRRGLPGGWGAGFMPTQPHHKPPPPSQLPQASPPPPRGQVSTHLSTQHLQGRGQGSWAGALRGPQKLGSLLGGLRLGPSTCNSQRLSRGGRGACAAAGCPRCLGGMQGKPCLGKASACPSICAGVSGGSVVQPGGDGAAGSLGPQGGLCSVCRQGEGEPSAAGSQMMSRWSRQRRDRQ